jgi:hypothetical protein
MYKMRGGDLEWTEPEDTNIHVEISVRDGADNRFVPGLDVEVELVAHDTGEPVFKGILPMLWHPWLARIRGYVAHVDSLWNGVVGT